MQYSDLYDQVYKMEYLSILKVKNRDKLNSFENDFQHSSLKSFIELVLKNFHQSYSPHVLVLGCGMGQSARFLAEKNIQVTAIDFSHYAIQLAELLTPAELKINFIKADCTQLAQWKNQIPLDKFSLIIDNHLLHCLSDDQNRSLYFQNLDFLMANDGHFLLETMFFESNLTVSDPYIFDQNYYLWKKDHSTNQFIPYRKILPPHLIEKEILSYNFEIKYLKCQNHLKFSITPPTTDNQTISPSVLQLIAQKRTR